MKKGNSFAKPWSFLYGEAVLYSPMPYGFNMLLNGKALSQTALEMGLFLKFHKNQMLSFLEKAKKTFEGTQYLYGAMALDLPIPKEMDARYKLTPCTEQDVSVLDIVEGHTGPYDAIMRPFVMGDDVEALLEGDDMAYNVIPFPISAAFRFSCPEGTTRDPEGYANCVRNGDNPIFSLDAAWFHWQEIVPPFLRLFICHAEETLKVKFGREDMYFSGIGREILFEELYAKIAALESGGPPVETSKESLEAAMFSDKK